MDDFPPDDVGPPEPGRPQSAEEIVGIALGLAPESRASYVESVCEGNPVLARDVLDLLSHSDPADAFFGQLEAALGPLLSAAEEGRLGFDAPGPPAADPSAAPDLSPGARVGPYRIVQQIGAGGMGAVYQAEDPRLGREVALKFLPPWLAADPRAIERFRREARAAAALDHPNICTIYEIGETEGGRPFIAMALYRGETLWDRLDRGPLPPEEAARIAIAVARALEAAHAAGIVHRDVKPGNVMLTEDGRVVLLDFGLARVEDLTLTRPGMLRGTVAYMAPEQVQGEEVGPQADLWALGVVLYEMLAGERPFRGARESAVFHAILETEPRPLPELRPEVPGELAAIARRLLRKDPAERYASAGELLADLVEGDRRELGLRSLLEGWTTGTPPRASRKEATGRVRRRPAAAPTRRRVALAAAGAALVALAAIGAWRLHRSAGPTLDDHLVAVFPFRVDGADPSLRVLRKGMVDLISTKLASGRGPKAVDPATLLYAWGHAGGGSAKGISLTRELELARASFHAGHVLQGSVASLGGEVVLSATLYDASSGKPEPPVSVQGPPDSLPELVDRLTGGVLSVRAGDGARLISLTTESLPALRLFLKGQAEYRNGRYDQAALDFAHAVGIDSTFALAAFRGWLAAKSGDFPVHPPATFLRAWRYRDRLAPQDREFLEVLYGPDTLDRVPTHAEVLASRRELVRRQPENPYAWYFLALWLPLSERSKPLDRALALDSTFLPALQGLWVRAAGQRDTAAMRRYAARYVARSSTGLTAELLRCVQAGFDSERPAVAAIMARADSVEESLPGRCLFHYDLFPALSAVRDSAAEYLLGQALQNPEQMRETGGMLYDFALDGGRPAEAARIFAAYGRDFPQDSLTDLSYRIRNALWWEADPDRRGAAAAAHALAARLAAHPPDSAGTPASNALCVLGQWRLAARHTAQVGAVIRILRALGDDDEAPDEERASSCARVLAAWRAAEEGSADAGARIDSLTSNRGEQPHDHTLRREAALILARLLETRGDRAGALAALRSVAHVPPFYYKSTFLREQGRLAAQVGDTAAAIDDYRRYLALRTHPEPVLRPEVERVRAALDSLVQSSGR